MQNLELKLPVTNTPTFSLAKAVCSHGLFMMAPNHWDPKTNSLFRPLRLSSTLESLTVRISQPSPLYLLVSVIGVSSLSNPDQQAILGQVRRMLRISEENDRMIREFHQLHADSKERGFGRVFRSPTLFEDMVKCILLCNCQWPRTLSIAKALCDLQLELKGGTITADSAPNTTQSREPKMKQKIKKNTDVKSKSYFVEHQADMGSEITSENSHDNHLVNNLPMLDETDFVEDGKQELTDENKSADTRGTSSTVPLHTCMDEVSYTGELLPAKMKDDCNGANQSSLDVSCMQTGNFPSPEELANIDADYLSRRCGLGYRAKRIVPLAQNIVEGKIQYSKLEEICDGSTQSSYDELDKQLSGLFGFGPFTRANVLMCMGFYDKIPSDTETIRHLQKVHRRSCLKNRSLEQNIEIIYGKYAPFQFLAYWSELWAYYEETFGNMIEMEPSYYQLITASNMQTKKRKMKN